MAHAEATRVIAGAKSIRGGGSLEANRAFQLDGDVQSPGPNKYYGTNSDGQRGWWPIVTAPAVSVDISGKSDKTTTILGQKSITGGGSLGGDRTLELSGDAESPGATVYYGTNGAGVKGFYPIPAGPGGSTPSGTGFRHVTGGVEDGSAKLVENADIAPGAAIAESKLNLNFPTHSNALDHSNVLDHSNANDPSAGEKQALMGTTGTPSNNNKYVTDEDPRNSNVRPPAPHTHVVSSITPLATQRVIAKNSGGSGAAEEVTISQILDWIGNTRGSLLVRRASTWDVMTPGPILHVLRSQGAGADPIWDVPQDPAGWTNILKVGNQDVTNAGVTNDNIFFFSVTNGVRYMVDMEVVCSGNNTTGDYIWDFVVDGVGCTQVGKGSCQNLTSAGAVQNIIVSGTGVQGTAQIVTGAPSANLDDLVAVRILYAFTVGGANGTFRYRFGNSAPSAGRTSRTWQGSIMKWKQLI